MTGVTGPGGISVIGLGWGMLSAVSMAVFFVLSDRPAKPGTSEALSPVVLRSSSPASRRSAADES